ncbi:MAG: hypothetical protein HFI61_00315 [Lachnospiraceae bacterium]|nr:hypothetical protein [Lachnospiraceae bacterium]
MFGRDFADFVKSSGNYFVLVNRAPFRMLPYSIHEIYEIITAGKRTDIRESYHEFKELYSHYPVVKHNKVENIITEDSCSGHQFFTTVFGTADVVSADGNSNILPVIQTLVKGDTLVIADGAAFGAMIENCLAYLETRIDLRVSIWLPESFEYLILKSGVIKGAELEAVLEEPADYIDSLQHESWEQFFTDLLISLTKDTAAKYSKEVLNKYYLQDKNIRKIELQFPDVINIPEKSR